MKLKELEDYEGFPKTLRKFQVETIGYLVQMFGVYKSVPTILDALIKKNKINSIVDLCSGSGLPSIYVKKRMQQKAPILLTDKFPQVIPNIEGVNYENTSVDILQLQPQPNILYTIYNAFHHFTEVEKKNILEKFRNNKATLFIVEVIEPSLISLINVLFASTIVQLCIAPFIKPFSWVRLFFTYIIPINIVTVLIDGIISVLKSKSKKQYQQLVQNVSTKNYTLETKAIFNFPTKIITITAQPF
jgi:hypothetical protein